ncbi:uncharacterized protein si:ch73-90k17.1 isoform X2 [Sardina pilchardus]|uniref:uncharacterized protein si:ch73-90k17.1 isoform X2 n=1 Tax=Sardina pilchardus TaxID=27697 RepID=UPI002E1054AF
MIGIPKACPVVYIVIALVGVLPTCLGSDEEVSNTSSNSTKLLPNEATGENVSEDEVISYRQPRSASPADYAKREAAYKNYMLRTRTGKTVPEDPEVLCGDKSIHVRIRSGDAENLHVLAPNGLPLTLKELPVYCNIITKTLSKHVVLVSRFDGCFVQPQDSAYVLNLMWFGRPIQATCPREQPPLIICKTHSMDVLFFGDELKEKLSVNVNGRWIPLQHAPALCQFEVYTAPQMLSFSTTYVGCGITRENGFHNLTIRSEERDMSLSCPDIGIADPLSKTPTTPEQPSKASQLPQPPQVQRVPQQVPQQASRQTQVPQASRQTQVPQASQQTQVQRIPQQTQVLQASQQNQVQQGPQEEMGVTMHKIQQASQLLRPAVQNFLNSQAQQFQQVPQQNQVQQASPQTQLQQVPEQTQVPQSLTQEVSQASNQVFETLYPPPSEPSNSLARLFARDPWSRVGY